MMGSIHADERFAWICTVNAAMFYRQPGEKFLYGALDTPHDEKPDAGEQGKFFLCRFCRSRITSAAQMIAVNGSHRHLFTNPHGKVYEVGCFSGAPGCINNGSPSMECTWFAGCSWCYSLCATCFSHLGWKYQSDLRGPFFGLILVNLMCR